MPNLGGVGQVEIGAAAVADLDVELVDLAAARTAALGLLGLRPVEDHGDQAQSGSTPPISSQMKNELPFPRPMMPVASPNETARIR